MPNSAVSRQSRHLQDPPGIEVREAKPVRLRLSRRKGFDLQATSRALNGLPAVNVARPSRWGNPFRFNPADSVDPATRFACEIAPLLDASPLRAKNLACFCRLEARCHADVLLELANPADIGGR